MSLKSFQFLQSAAGGNGTVTLISTDANLTGGPISTSGTIGLANVISFGQGNVALTNSNVGTAIVNMNMLNATVNNLNSQAPVQYATTVDLGSVTYSNGTSGVGATLTKTSPFSVLAIDGYTFLTSDVTNSTRVLIKNESSPAYNGAYIVTNIGSGSVGWVLTRANDYNQSSEIAAGDGFYVISGSTNANTTWVQQTPAPITIGTSSIVFTQFAKVSTGTVTNIGTDSNLTGGFITTTGNIGLANVITFYAGNVTTTNSNVGTAIVNINTLNAAVNGLNAQIPVNYASTANLSVTYNNGTSGVGATLTATTNGVLSLDGSPAVTQRVLIKDQTANVQNGVYTVTVVGTAGTPFILTRATDYDQSAEIAAGDGFYVISGSTQNNTTWVQQTPAPVTLGSTAITFVQFGAGGAPTGLPKQPYTANTALYANSTTTLTLGVLPSAAGGTGLTTFTAANNAIYSTSASGLTAGTLPITAGGTGAANATAALANLGGVSTGKAIAMAIVFGG